MISCSVKTFKIFCFSFVSFFQWLSHGLKGYPSRVKTEVNRKFTAVSCMFKNIIEIPRRTV